METGGAAARHWRSWHAAEATGGAAGGDWGLAAEAALDTRVLGGGRCSRYGRCPAWASGPQRSARPAAAARHPRTALPPARRGAGRPGLHLDPPLPAPQQVGGSLYVPLDALRLLGVRTLADAPGLLDFAAPASVPQDTLPPRIRPRRRLGVRRRPGAHWRCTYQRLPRPFTCHVHPCSRTAPATVPTAPALHSCAPAVPVAPSPAPSPPAVRPVPTTGGSLAARRPR